MTGERRAWAYLSRVAEPPCRGLAALAPGRFDLLRVYDMIPITATPTRGSNANQ